MAFIFVVTICDCVKLVDGIYVSLQSVIVATGLENCHSVTNQFINIPKQSGKVWMFTDERIFVYAHFEKSHVVLFFSR